MGFVIFGLPRSRTTWLAKYLTYGPFLCGHDMAVLCKSTREFLGNLAPPLIGTVETGAVRGWRVIKHARPEMKMVTIRRPLGHVVRSLEKLGFPVGSETYQELINRNKEMDRLEKEGKAWRIEFRDLENARTCALLFEHCLELPFDFQHWLKMDAEIVLHPFDVQQEYVNSHQGQIVGLKREVDELTREILNGGNPLFPHVALEAWTDKLGKEAEHLAAGHFYEVAGNDEPNRKFKLDFRIMGNLHKLGAMKVLTARVNGQLAGYLTWILETDVECEGLLTANQGAWFVSPDVRFAKLRLGHKLFKLSLAMLKGFGVKNVNLHHRVHGRGAELGRYFQALGATPTQHNYSLWIGD